MAPDTCADLARICEALQTGTSPQGRAGLEQNHFGL